MAFRALSFQGSNALEVALVFVEEILEEVVDVDLALDVVWQFTHESDIGLIIHSTERIILPEVVEEIFDFGD